MSNSPTPLQKSIGKGLKGLVFLAYCSLLFAAAYERRWNLTGLMDLLFFATFLVIFFDWSGRWLAPPSQDSVGSVGIARKLLHAIGRVCAVLWGLLLASIPVLVGAILFEERFFEDADSGRPPFVFFITSALIIYSDYVWTICPTWYQLASVLLPVALFILASRCNRRTGARWTFLGFVSLYAFAAYACSTFYHDFPPPHDKAEVRAQPHTTLLPLDKRNTTARKLRVDDAETTLFLATQRPMMRASTRMFGGGREKDVDPNKKEGGLLKYRLDSQKEMAFYDGAVGDDFIVHPDGESVYLSRFTEKELVTLSASALSPTGKTWTFDPAADGIGLLDKQTMAVRIELPWHSADLFIIDLESGQETQTTLSKPFLMDLNSGMEVVASRGEVFLLTNGNDQTRLAKIDSSGKLLAETLFPGWAFEAYFSPSHQRLFIPMLTANKMLEVDPADLSMTSHEIPLGVREVAGLWGGLLALGGYLSSEVYIYDPKTAQILKTLKVGRKPEGIVMGPKTGKLYVASSYGLAIFDLPAILGREDFQK